MKQIKKILSIVLLITVVLFTSCKEETQVPRTQNSSIKNVKNLSYSFINNQGKKDSTAKSDNEVKSCLTSDSIQSVSKVLAIETFEVDGELFTASLIEESELIETKVSLPNPQLINGSGVYTFYAYNNSAIKEQEITADKKKFEVPKDAAANYGMIFLSVVDGTGIPATDRLVKNTNANNKGITYTTVFNENVCYKTFDKDNMPTDDVIDIITFTPVFSQIGISVPKNLSGKTIKVDEFRLEQGVQETAVVKIDYNGQERSNISVTYQQEPTTDYKQVLECVPNTAGDATILKGDYYNIIPNGNDAQVYIKMSAEGTTAMVDRVIEFKNDKLEPIPFESKKRYLIKIQNKVETITIKDFTITPNPLNIKPGETGDLTATVTMSDGSNRTTGFTWKINPPDGVVTSTDGGVVSPSPQDMVTGDNSTTNTLSLAAKADYYGSTTVTVTYGDLSTTANVNVYRDIPATRYYMWDAPVGDYYTSTYPDNNYNDITSGNATQSCANAPTDEQMWRYLGAGVYRVEYGPPFMGVNGNIYRGGWLLKKYANIPEGTDPAEGPVTTQTDFSKESSTDQAQHFFLPGCGGAYHGGSLLPNHGVIGYYWLSTPNPSLTDYAYYLSLQTSSAYVHYGARSDGCVPLVGFDPTYVPVEPASIDLTASPTSIAKGKSSTLTAVVTYADGSTRTNPAGINFSSSNIDVIAHPGSTASAKGNAEGSADITASITGKGKTVQSDAVKITVTPAVATAVATEIVSFSAEPTTIDFYGGKSKLTAVVKYSDGTTQTNSSGVMFTSNDTGVIPSPETSTTAIGYAPGTAVITAKLGTLTKTVTITVSTMSYTVKDYYQWDAQAPYNPNYPYEDFGPGLSGYNPTTTGSAEYSCKYAPTLEEVEMYLGAGVYWVTDGPAYTLPNGDIYRTGLMLKKKQYITNFENGAADKETYVNPKTDKSYEELKNDYFFLPAYGNYLSGSYDGDGTDGYYWSSTPRTADIYYAWYLYFSSGVAMSGYYGRNYCSVPMPRL